MRFDGRMSYSDYLGLDAVLSAQHPLSDAHDELLFIVQHQTSELWMKLALHEIGAARAAIAEDRLQPAFKMLARVARIFEQLNGAWDVLRTMTPSEYTQFRDKLGQSSGFQSWQYRMIEFTVGNRNAAMLRPHAHRAAVLAALEAEMARPSLYDEALRALRGGGSRCRRRCWRGTCGRPTGRTRASRRRGRRFTARPRRIGSCTSWPRSLWTSRTTSAGGGSTM